jgi:hypothetical protein
MVVARRLEDQDRENGTAVLRGHHDRTGDPPPPPRPRVRLGAASAASMAGDPFFRRRAWEGDLARRERSAESADDDAGDGRRTARRLGVARASRNGTGPSPGVATREPSVQRWEGFLANLPSCRCHV